MTSKEKKKALHSTQEFCPVADVTAEGIIITKFPTRYCRILKFTPINFNLLSETEKSATISSFANLLRILPPKTHIKVLSRRADTSEQLNNLFQDIKKETIPQCKQLQIDQARLINEMRERGITTDFFLIYEYFHEGSGTPTYEEIVHSMDDMQAVIRGELIRCGNSLITPTDKTPMDVQLEYLYMVFSRSQAQNMSFSERKNKMVLNMLAEKGLSENEELVIAPANLISPRLINDRFSSSQILVDDLYYSFLYIPAKQIPDTVWGGWVEQFIAIAAGIDLDIFLEAIPAQKIRQKLRVIQNVNETNYRRAAANNDPSFYDLERIVRAGQEIQAELSGGDKFYTFGIMLTITHSNRETLSRLTKTITSSLKGRNMDLKPFLGRQKEALLASLPLCEINPALWKGMRRNAIARCAASIYPFISSNVNNPGGLFLGRNLTNGSMVFLNPFDTSVYTNANMTILGMSGAGKSFLLKCLALRARIAHIQTFIIAPEKGHEFIFPTQAVGGAFIRFGGGSSDNINILDIRPTNVEMQERIYGKAGIESLLIQKCEQIQIFFELLLNDIEARERTILDNAVVATFKERGITEDNRSLYDPRNPTAFKPMPILGDLQRNLKSFGPDAARLVEALERFVLPTGSASSFNRPTNVDLNNQFIVFDVSKMSDELIPIGMFIALDYLWSVIKDDPSQRKMLFIDEVWKLLGADAAPRCAKFVTAIWKLIRSYNGSAVGATQNLDGFFARRESASDVINNSQISFLLKSKGTEINLLKDAFGLTKTECEQLLKFQKGEVLLVAGAIRALMKVDSSETEYELITTDPNDYRRRASY